VATFGLWGEAQVGVDQGFGCPMPIPILLVKCLQTMEEDTVSVLSSLARVGIGLDDVELK
jgi:hypothetical protein